MSDPSIFRDEVLLRRVPNRPDRTKQKGSVLRATSFALRPQQDEFGPSFSLASTTSPKQLLGNLPPDQDAADWYVCALRAQAVIDLGWSIEVTPDRMGNDPGHCEIRPGVDVGFSRERWSRLSQQTRILTSDEVASLKPGDQIQI